MTDDFAEALAAPTPAPGGGAAAARVGLYAASLVRMVLGITLARLADEPLRRRLAGAQAEVERLAACCRRLEDEDGKAFETYLQATRLPQGTEEERNRRAEARARAALGAAAAPLSLMEVLRDLLGATAGLSDLAERKLLRAASDLAVAAELAAAAFRAAEITLRANFPQLLPADLAACKERGRSLSAEVEALYLKLRGAADG